MVSRFLMFHPADDASFSARSHDPAPASDGLINDNGSDDDSVSAHSNVPAPASGGLINDNYSNDDSDNTSIFDIPI